MKLLLIALAMLFVLPAPVSSVGVISSADGPTKVFVTAPDKTDANVAIIGGADGPTEVFTSGMDEADALAIIGGADGPTTVLVSGSPRLLPALCGFLCVLFANAGR